MWDDDLVTILTNAGAGTFGTSLFVGRGADIPSGDGGYTLIIPTGGTGPDWTQNSAGPAYRKPGAEIIAIAKVDTVARALVELQYNALVTVRNQFINTTVWYVSIVPLNEPHDLPLDDMKRVRIAFNVLGDKRPT